MQDEKPPDFSKLFKPDYCKKCGTPFVKYPIKAQPEKTLYENYKEKTIIWKNLFKMDIISIILFISIILMTYGYKADIAQCNEVMANPYEFCVKAGCQPNPLRTITPPIELPIYNNVTNDKWKT